MHIHIIQPPSTEMAWTVLLVFVLVVAWYGIAVYERYARHKRNRRTFEMDRRYAMRNWLSMTPEERMAYLDRRRNRRREGTLPGGGD